MLPEMGARPRVYYLNIPKKFIGGTVYDPVEKEVVEEAACTLTETKTGKKYTATTDGFGDFWFESLQKMCCNIAIAVKRAISEHITVTARCSLSRL
jgi:hypothetical protein